MRREYPCETDCMYDRASCPLRSSIILRANSSTCKTQSADDKEQIIRSPIHVTPQRQRANEDLSELLVLL